MFGGGIFSPSIIMSSKGCCTHQYGCTYRALNVGPAHGKLPKQLPAVIVELFDIITETQAHYLLSKDNLVKLVWVDNS